MRRGQKIWSPILAALAISSLALALACGPDKAVVAAAARAEEWGVLQGLQSDLAQQRTELADLRAQREAVASGPAEGEEEITEEAKAELDKAFNNLDFQVQELTNSFGQRLVNFINDAQMEQGAEPTEMLRAAFRFQATEELLVADEYGDAGGDWARAIAIAEEAERRDPSDPQIQDRLAHYRAMRYMTEERLAKAEAGMTLDEVKAALGIPSRGNDREFSDDRRAFYYLKDANKSAAAVFFQKKGDQWVAYKVDFHALEGNSE